MHKSFCSGFEKTAFARAALKGVASVGKGLFGAGKSVGKALLTTKDKATGTRSFSPMKALGTTLGLSEMSDVAHKSNAASKALRGINGGAVQNIPRHSNINRGIGQTSIR